MDKVEFIKITDSINGEITEHAIIDRGNGEFTSMTKAFYNAQKAEAKTLKVVDEAAPE